MKCFPILEDNIEIDKNNHIHIQISHSLQDIWEKQSFQINIGKRNIEVPIEQILLKKQQLICIKNSGISQMNSDNVYDVSQRSHIYIYLILS